MVSTGERPAVLQPPRAHPLVRELVDHTGRLWLVVERRLAEASLCSPRLCTRRGYEHGWLTFRSGSDAFRIAPFPTAWATLSDFELERWLARALFEARVRRPHGP